ncbi:glycosyltransferase family 2 protein [Cellvibrio japonicus]|nr:glycosyltransferase family 2 protein [Cellvibrio japonicus]QEI12152.1 glycosyltransferase family 2 protein [Cellvibrio japonicus]QEI15726.1 glycosyltransferase family 2 protein [Cellvibrio japonicus]QEI19304.1 glycosyltransferase family 2 protein [Cellvibrio japonicus]
MTDHIPSLAVVIPCYNEEEMLPKTLATMLTLREQMIARGKISPDSKIYLVDDGSKDKTWDILSDAANSNTAIVGVKLSRNKGHQNALYAGLCVTTEDITVSIDADLQDDPQNIEAMVDEYLKGHDVVYGVRSARDTDTFFKRFTAEGYYHLMKKMGVDLVFNHADFRLMSRRALEALKEYGESNLFLRGVVREVGFPSSVVEYERQAREAGESKYPLKKMLSFAWKGITAFSTAPLRMITLLGLLSGFASFTLIAWVLVIRFFTDNATPGWASVLLPLLFIGSVQLLCLGIIGEYLSKIYEEVKRRPKFHISDIARKDN